MKLGKSLAADELLHAIGEAWLPFAWRHRRRNPRLLDLLDRRHERTLPPPKSQPRGDHCRLASPRVAYRGRGVGMQLFEGAGAFAREAGAKALYVSATPTENTVDFYLNRGCVLKRRDAGPRHIRSMRFRAELAGFLALGGCLRAGWAGRRAHIL
jgi:GNAT superfamily N-acetyltransferase